MAPSLRALFLAAFFLCLTSAPVFATPPSVSDTEKKDFVPVEWPLTNYPCQKLPAEDAACLIDEIMRHMSANTLETEADKRIFDVFVESVAKGGTTAQKKQILDSLTDIPQHLMQKNPDDNALRQPEPETAKSKQQYHTMILLLSLGKIDAAVDFLKHAAKTTQLRPSPQKPLQTRGLDFLLETQTADVDYDFAKKTAHIFYIVQEGWENPIVSYIHPLSGLLHKQLHSNGFSAAKKIAGLAKEDNFFSRFSHYKDLDITLASYARTFPGADARAHYNKFCHAQGKLAEEQLQQIPAEATDSAFAASLANFSSALNTLYALDCFKDYPEILLDLAKATQSKDPPLPETEWHSIAPTEGSDAALPMKRLPASIAELQHRAQIYERIKAAPPSTENRMAGVLPSFLHDVHYWAASLCPREARDICVQQVSKEYSIQYEEKILRALNRSAFQHNDIADIQYFITRFNSTLRMNDFINPKKLFENTAPLDPWRASLALEAIKALTTPEITALYLAEKDVFYKDIPSERERAAIVHIFQTAPPDQISALLLPEYEKKPPHFYIDTVLPQLDAARFDIIKDPFWQIYTRRCMNAGSAQETTHQQNLRYAHCLLQAFTR